MLINLHQKLRESIASEARDVALIAAPGMGLSTFLRSAMSGANVVFVEPATLVEFWETEFKMRTRNKRFVIHAATIDALVKNGIVNVRLGRDAIFQTNLGRFLTDFDFGASTAEKCSVVLDDFDELPDDLEKIVLDELKAISDYGNTKVEYRALKRLRFVIGGCLDFREIYASSMSGISPATQFCKHYPGEFLLAKTEMEIFFQQNYPELEKTAGLCELIIDWSGGHIFYVEELSKWVIQQLDDLARINPELIMARFIHSVEENAALPIFKYCMAGWERACDNPDLREILYRALRTGSVWDIGPNSKSLMKMGLLLEIHSAPQLHMYRVTNRVVEIFLRQHFAELGLLLPLKQSAFMGMKVQNGRGYSLLIEIENTIRNFIGDNLFRKYGSDWPGGLNISLEDGSNILSEASDRFKEDQESIYSAPELYDSLISYIDFGDLPVLIERYKSDFPNEFGANAPGFLRELNFLRRRIAHSRAIAADQIDGLESRWEQMRRTMMKRK